MTGSASDQIVPLRIAGNGAPPREGILETSMT